MHAPPDPSISELRTALVSGWRIETSSIRYAPVGFGNYHWTVVEASSRRWFVTANAVADSSTRLPELNAALRTAFTLRRDAGLEFVGAPVQRLEGGLLQTSGRYAIAVFPHLDVVTETSDYRAAARVVDLIVVLHAATPVVEQIAGMDDFLLPGRWSVQRLLDSA